MNVIVLAGGYDQIALINEFKNRGAKVILIDYLDNPPAKDFADIHYVESTLDSTIVKEIAIKEKADLITTACTDQALLTVAQVSEELGLSCYISFEQARNVTNKNYMKTKMLESKTPTAKFKVVKNFDISDIIDLKFPIVVKPSDCNSSKGVKIVETIDDYKTFINDALKLSRTKTAIIEEFIDGKEISVDAFVIDGRAKVVLITESTKIEGTKGFTITQSKLPVNLKPHELQEINDIVQNIADSFELPNSPLLVQMIINEKGANVIEFSARMGGGTKYKLIEVITSFDIMKTYVDLVMGEKLMINLNQKYSHAHLNYCYAHKGKFIRLEGFDELKDKNIIDEYFQYKSVGENVVKAKTSSDRVAGYLIASNDIDVLLNKEEISNNSLKIISDSGEDMMRHDLI